MQLITALMIALQVNIPVLIWGEPGIGKSSTISAIAKLLNLPIEIVISSVREPSDFAGLPIVHNGEVKLAPPSWAKRLAQAQKGILFLDELSTSPPAVQAALLRVILDKVVGDLELGKDIAIIAAANPIDSAAGGWDLAPPTANRFIHLDWKIDPKAWAKGLLNGWKLEVTDIPNEDWESELPVANHIVSTFIERFSNALIKIPKDVSQSSKAWPSPRTWHFISKILASCRANKVPKEVLELLVIGTVGEAAGAAFLDYLALMDLPDPEALLTNPTYTFPKNRSDKVDVILASVISAVKRQMTVDRYYQGVKVLCNAGQQGFVDLAYPKLKALLKAKPDGARQNIPELSIFGEVLKDLGLAA